MAETVNEQLLDASISHAIDLRGYSNSVVLRMIAILNKADKHLSAAITDALLRLPQEAFTVRRLDAMLVNVNALNKEAYKALQDNLTEELRSFVDYEAQYQADLFKSILPVQISVASVAPAAVYAAAMARPFQVSKGGAVPLNEYLAGLSESRAGMVRDAIRLGYITGETNDQIVKRIIGTKTLNYADGLMDISRRHVETMVRTATNHTASVARDQFYKANDGLVKGVMWVSTLDSRTSSVCQALDGQVFPVDSGKRPPAHLGCRSSTTPVLKSWRELGIDLPEFAPSTRASMDGQVPEDLTYQKWLEQQSASRQDEILGKTRAKLFRAGETVDRFVDKNGRTLTLDQLRKRDADIFQKAGL